jgi:hypothetical protein
LTNRRKNTYQDHEVRVLGLLENQIKVAAYSLGRKNLEENEPTESPGRTDCVETFRAL